MRPRHLRDAVRGDGPGSADILIATHLPPPVMIESTDFFFIRLTSGKLFAAN
jgi:hypothetical protein